VQAVADAAIADFLRHPIKQRPASHQPAQATLASERLGHVSAL